MYSLKSKLLATSILPIIITMVLLSIAGIFNLVSNNESMIELYEKDMLKEKQQLIKNQILSANGLIEAVLAKQRDKEEAKKEIINIFSKIRYLENKSGYFFAYEEKNGKYHFAFHGTKPQLNGKETDITKPDIKGFAFRKALIENGLKDRFVTYHYQKPNTDKVLKKIAYSKYIKELNWTLVTGIYVDDVYKQIKQMDKINSDSLRFSIIETGIISVVLLLASIVLIVFLVSNFFNKPLKEFEEGIVSFFRYLNKETDNIEYLNSSSKDELGLMSKLINDNIMKTKKNIDEEREVINSTITILSEFEKGDLSQRVDTSSSNPALGKLTELLNQMGENLENNINDILSTLERYTHYDYLDEVETKDLKEHIFKLAQGVNILGGSITQMLIENKAHGTMLDSSAKKLLENVKILSTSSNEAAASLEQTAAALEEMTGNISSNTQNIVQMASYADEVTNAAARGQNLANDTTTAMDQINSEVTAINEAITVIDQIAFQTNILSLNAAVEAATAGEAGKGFAVVAQEVRNLASRSAEAANEIKSLVENATAKANNGKNIADEMIEGYSHLNESISKTIELISNVESSSKEQLSGIEQINNAVTLLDAQTQKNASVANQTQEIANTTASIAKSIVDSTDSKKFKGDNN